MSPTTHLALITSKDGNLELKETKVPKPGPNEVLIKVIAIAQNPVDWKKAKLWTVPDSVAGCDFSGIVVELGPGAESTRRLEERVAGFAAGGVSPDNGAFAEYVVANADLCIALPDDWDHETAAQLPIAAFTTCQIFDQSLGLPIDSQPSTRLDAPPILVYAASSAVGMYAVQFAKLGKHRVYATCSPKNYDRVKALGVDEVFDYRDPDVGEKIKTASSGKIKYAVDCISEGGTDKIIASALSDEGGKIACIVVPGDIPRPNVEFAHSMAFDLIVDRPGLPSRIKQTPHYAKIISGLLAAGKLRPSPTLVMPKGLAGVEAGFKYYTDGKVSAQKVIYRIADTPGLEV